MKKNKKRDDIKFIDIEQQSTNNNDLLLSPTINIVHFAEQEDDSDLSEGNNISSADMIRKHLLSKFVSAAVNPVIVDGCHKCGSAVRYISNIGYIVVNYNS